MGNDAPFLLLLPAAGAYWILTRAWQFSYRLKHERPGLVAYQVVLFAILLLSVGLVIHTLIESLEPSWHANLNSRLAEVLAPAIAAKNVPFAIACLYALGIGLLAPLPLNCIARRRGRDRDTYYLRANRDDAFEAQWYAAHRDHNFRLVQLTLDTNKVYIGTVAECPATDAGNRRSILLLPMASGYRDVNTLELVLTTDYIEASSRIEQDSGAVGQFEVVIRAERIVSSSPFDFVLYSSFSQNEVSPAENSPNHTAG
jgi:hypothetical protein